MDALPHAVQALIERLAQEIPAQELMAAVQRLSHIYRIERTTTPPMGARAEHIAYLTTRLPATFAVACEVLRRACARLEDPTFFSLLDVGAGPGSATMAAITQCATLRKVCLLDRDAALLEWAEAFLSAVRPHGDLSVRSACQNVERGVLDACEPSDLVMASYVLSELSEEGASRLVDSLLTCTAGMLVIIEPGTPRGFRTVHRARAQLIANGARVVAPCPASGICPIGARQDFEHDWCHFSCRLPRSRQHRLAKEAERGFEDEKFSYVACVPARGRAFSSPVARIVGQPRRRSGHVYLRLCTQGEAIVEAVISRKQGDAYNQVKKAEWGDAVEMALW